MSSKYLLENESLTEVKDEIAGIINLTKSLSEDQQRELLAFAKGYQLGSQKLKNAKETA